MIFLPVHLSKRGCYRIYESRVKKIKCWPISWPTFLDVWKNHLPHVKVYKAETGLCYTCTNFKEKIRTVPDNQVAEYVEGYTSHIQQAISCREKYSNMQQRAKTCWREFQSCGGNRLTVAHISFDYARALEYPALAREHMDEFFLPRVRVQLFGVVNEGSMEYYNYLWREPASHGSTEVISALHDYLTTQQPEVGACNTLVINVDNCSGQNKNRFLVNYLVLRVLAGYHNQVQLRYVILIVFRLFVCQLAYAFLFILGLWCEGILDFQ
jgi:hypothetical protein